MEKTASKTKKLIQCSLFIALITVGTYIKVPIPVLPFTLQFLFTMLAGLILGPKMGASSVYGYMLLGLLGLPVFTEGGGIQYIVKPSFGYIIGFCIASYVTGKIANSVNTPSLIRILFANFTGLFIVYSLGMVYYYLICKYVLATPIGIKPLFLYCFVLAVPGDILLCFVSVFLAKRLIPVLR